MKFITIITTYNRPALCARLLRNIVREAKAFGEHEVIIADDGSRPAYHHQITEIMTSAGIPCTLVWHGDNNGKEYYWKVVHDLYQRVQSLPFNYVVQLPDDVQLHAGFYRRAAAALDAIPMTDKACLNLYRCHRNEQWGSTKPIDVCFGGTDMRRTDWMDMCFIANRRMMELLQYSVHQVHRDWSRHPELGSGVGPQLSRRLRSMGGSIWQLSKSLVIDDGEQDSQMNPSRPFKIQAV